MNAKRGYVPEDEQNFSSEALETMRTASAHIVYLINEGYDLKQVPPLLGTISSFPSGSGLLLCEALPRINSWQNGKRSWYRFTIYQDEKFGSMDSIQSSLWK